MSDPFAERRAAIVAAWESGRPAIDVAREFGISRERVRQLLAKAGHPSGRHPRPPRPEPRCTICGRSYGGSAREHARAARHAMCRARTHEPAAKTMAMAQEYARGGDASAIATRYGVTRATVYAAANSVVGAVRYTDTRTGPRTPARQEAIKMLRNGDPSWLVCETTKLDSKAVAQLKRRWVDLRGADR